MYCKAGWCGLATGTGALWYEARSTSSVTQVNIVLRFGAAYAIQPDPIRFHEMQYISFRISLTSYHEFMILHCLLYYWFSSVFIKYLLRYSSVG